MFLPLPAFNSSYAVYNISYNVGMILFKGATLKDIPCFLDHWMRVIILQINIPRCSLVVLKKRILNFIKNYHLNACYLQHHIGCSKDTTLQVSTQCPDCAPYHNTSHLRVNPHGLKPNDIWQMDVTHLPSAGSLKYMHASLHTYSEVVFASLHTGEYIKDVLAHYLVTFAYMGIP